MHKTFLQSLSSLVWSAYPKELRNLYCDVLDTKVLDGQGNKMFVIEDLLQAVLCDDVQFKPLAKQMNKKYEHDLMIAHCHYVNFIEGKPIMDGNEWPDFNSNNFASLFLPPREGKLKTVFDTGFSIIKPYLERDIFSRSPSRIVCFDGTYPVAMRTMDDAESDIEIKVLVIATGEFGHVLLWFYCSAEGARTFQMLNFMINKRREMLDCFNVDSEVNNVISRVDTVQADYSDVCCEGCTDVNNHWFPKIWPNAPRSPYRDLFHAEKKLNESTQPHHPLRNTFVCMLSDTCLVYNTPSINHVLNSYKKKEKNKNGSSDFILTTKMMKKAYRIKIRNKKPNRMLLEQNVV